MVSFELLLAAFDFALREMALFAATGFLVLGLNDLLLDLFWIGRTLIRRFTVHRRHEPADALSLPKPERPGRLAIFVPAWDESNVIAQMVGNALARFGDGDFRLYVGCYPNDPATLAALAPFEDERLRVVVNPRAGPTTKADGLNRTWDAMRADEAASGVRFKAVVLHDAEDVVHSAELAIFDLLIERFSLVQLPVLPLIDPKSRWIAGTYADEFAEAHGKELVVREAVGAAVPSAGVGCAIARDALDWITEVDGEPFDAGSLTEDYELGLRLHRMGGRCAFVRLPAGPGKSVVAIREYFPPTMEEAVHQKARWMRGIALSGWDRLGWSGGFAERWMRMRDRQALVAALVLAMGYLAWLLWAVRSAGMTAGLPPLALSPALQMMLMVNGLLFLWRVGMRVGFVTHAYDWREGLRSIPRILVGNVISLRAAKRALVLYGGGRLAAKWDKTRHHFPAELPAE